MSELEVLQILILISRKEIFNLALRDAITRRDYYMYMNIELYQDYNNQYYVTLIKLCENLKIRSWFYEKMKSLENRKKREPISHAIH